MVPASPNRSVCNTKTTITELAEGTNIRNTNTKYKDETDKKMGNWLDNTNGKKKHASFTCQPNTVHTVN